MIERVTYIAWTLNPFRWRVGRYETYDIHPLTGREIVRNTWICLGPIAISFDENDPFNRSI